QKRTAPGDDPKQSTLTPMPTQLPRPHVLDRQATGEVREPGFDLQFGRVEEPQPPHHAARLRLQRQVEPATVLIVPPLRSADRVGPGPLDDRMVGVRCDAPLGLPPITSTTRWLPNHGCRPFPKSPYRGASARGIIRPPAASPTSLLLRLDLIPDQLQST